MPLNIYLGMPLTFLLREWRQVMKTPLSFRSKVAHKHFFKKILKVLQGTPLKNTSELKQRRKQYTEP
jgi:hypothetical protein